MKIGFCGAGGTGKSSVLKALEGKINIPFLPSVARSVYERRGITEPDQLKMTPAQLWELQKDIFDTRIKAERDLAHHFISDRTLIDHMAYCLVRASAGMTEKDFDEYEDKMQRSMDGYRLVFYFPFTIESRAHLSDGFRQTDVTYQVAIDAMINGLLNSYSISLIFVNPSSIEKQAQQVLERIKKVM